MRKLLFLVSFMMVAFAGFSQEVTDRVEVEVDTSAQAGLKSMGWKQISGPNTPTIVSPNSTKTFITGFAIAGIYVYEFKITDKSDRSATAQVKITVLPAWAGPEAKAKIVEYIIRAPVLK